MKKLGKLVLVSLLAMSLLVACGGGSGKGSTIKMGVASTQKVEIPKRNPDQAEFTVTVVGVALKDDKVAYIKIDDSQQFADFKDGEFTAETLKTKAERKEEYGMKDDSEILNKEWFEQIEALEAALIGLTKDEVKAYFGGEEVKTATTMFIDHIEATVLKAIDQTVEVTGVAKVGLGYEPKAQVKKDRETGAAINAETTLDYAMIAVDADGKIIKALLDNAQEKATVTDGAIELKNIGKTKGELKEEYGMLVTSPIEKEWFEQNDAIMEKLVGMTVTEFNAYNSDPKEEEDLKTTVTMDIEAYQTALKNAEANLTVIK